MFPYYLTVISGGAYSFIVESLSGSETGVLVALGLLLLVVGTILRRKLPSVEEQTVANPAVARMDRAHAYMGPVAQSVSSAPSQRHISAVSTG